MNDYSHFTHVGTAVVSKHREGKKKKKISLPAYRPYTVHLSPLPTLSIEELKCEKPHERYSHTIVPSTTDRARPTARRSCGLYPSRLASAETFSTGKGIRGWMDGG